MIAATAIIFYYPNTILNLPAYDVFQYFTKVQAVFHGTIPFHLLPLEYPVAAFPLMALPGFLTTNFFAYLAFFVLEMMIWNVACFFLVIKWVRREHGERSAPPAALWYMLWMVILTPLWGLRIDVPTATIIFAGFTLMTSRPGWAAFLGVLGGYIKLVPLVVTLAAIRQRRDKKTLLIAVGSLVGIAVLWWLIAETSMMYAIRYHLQRGIEIGSLYSGVLYGVGKIFHWQMSLDYRFSSVELTTPIPPYVFKLIPIIQSAAILYPLWRLRIGTSQRNLRLVMAMVLGYIVFGKVLSPQYVLWLVPLYAVLYGYHAKQQQLVFTAVCVVTTIIFPYLFSRLDTYASSVMFLDNIRNGLLVWLYWQSIRVPKKDPVLDMIPPGAHKV